jgi:(1->4)-alpha-D-glucan 1-alpha-D-glucosylmutase
LALKLLTLTAPGAPDLYQGSELWDLSLVDPDNRRPVDYDLRRELVKVAGEADLAALWAEGDEVGVVKLAMVHRALNLRARHRASFGDGKRGSYQPLAASGPAADHALAFDRGGSAITVVTRLPLSLERAGGWKGTALALPEGRWRDVLCGGTFEATVGLSKILSGLPVALLEKVK